MAAFVTYQNHRNPHVTLHAGRCSQIRKNGEHHAYGQGSYHDHETFAAAEAFAKQTGLDVISCSYCKKRGELP